MERLTARQQQIFDPVALLVYVLQYIAGSFRFALGGIRGEMPRSIRAAR